MPDKEVTSGRQRETTATKRRQRGRPAQGAARQAQHSVAGGTRTGEVEAEVGHLALIPL